MPPIPPPPSEPPDVGHNSKPWPMLFAGYKVGMRSENFGSIIAHSCSTNSSTAQKMGVAFDPNHETLCEEYPAAWYVWMKWKGTKYRCDSCKAGKYNQLKKPLNSGGKVFTNIEVVDGIQHRQKPQALDFLEN